MLPRDKRATLSSNLLAGKDGAPAGGEATPPGRPPARRSALREALEEIREAAKQEQQTSAKQKATLEPPPAAQEPLPEPPFIAEAPSKNEDDAEAGSGVLYSKGDASAAGFRPWYWSYERDGTPPVSDSAGTVTPLRASAPSPATSSGPVSAPATVDAKKRSPMVLVAGIAGVVAIAAAGGAWFAFSSSSPSISPAPHQDVAVAPISEPEPEPTASHLPPPAPPAHKPALADTAPVATPPSPPPAPAEVAPPPAPPVVAIVPAPPPAPPAPAASAPTSVSPEAAEFMKRGDDMLATGDIASARLFYERAAEQHHPAAPLALGKTYDPLFLEEVHARGIRGDAVQAAQWYRKAAASGDQQAAARLQHLLAKYPG